MANILDGAGLKAILSEAILASIDGAQREALIKAALDQLLTPVTRGGYGAKPSSPIEDAFRDAVGEIARTTARDMLASDPLIGERIKGLMADAAERAFMNKEEMVEKMARAIRESFFER